MKIEIETRINGKTISCITVPDPIHTTYVVMGWQDRLRFLFSRGEFSVRAICDSDATKAIMSALDDYIEEVRRGDTGGK